MGAIAIGAIVAGVAIGAAGTGMSANAASKKRKDLARSQDRWLPDMDRYTEEYFEDLQSYAPEADRLADQVATDDTDRALAMQERAMPGMTEGRQRAFDALMPLLRGELPPSVMDAFMRSGAASSVGSGFGGSGFGFVNQGLFGAKGALGAMQTGYGLLPALMSTLPMVNSPSTASFLNAIMTPTQRTQTQLQIRGQNMQNAAQVAGMQTGSEVWGGFLQETGGQIAGMGVGMMGGGGMGMMGGGANMTGGSTMGAASNYSLNAAKGQAAGTLY